MIDAALFWERLYVLADLEYFIVASVPADHGYLSRENLEQVEKLGGTAYVRSRTNEVLAKFLCHEVVVVHQSQVELAIEPVFWGDEPAERPRRATAAPTGLKYNGWEWA